MELLGRSGHSHAIKNHHGDRFLFAKELNIVLCDNPGKTSIFGCPAVRVGWQKRSYSEAERAWQEEYNEGKPNEWDNIIWAVYQVDWTKFTGDVIPGTALLEGGCQSSTGLSDATIYRFAVDVEDNKVVSYTSTSCWVEDRDDIPCWHKALFQKYPDPKLAEYAVAS